MAIFRVTVGSVFYSFTKGGRLILNAFIRSRFGEVGKQVGLDIIGSRCIDEFKSHCGGEFSRHLSGTTTTCLRTREESVGTSCGGLVI